MVGAIGFEPTTLWSQTRCATRLRYTPTSPYSTGSMQAFLIQRNLNCDVEIKNGNRVMSVCRRLG